MKQTNLWPRPLNEKDLTTDWIEETFGENGWMPTPQEFVANHSYLCYVKDVLVKVDWTFNVNQLTFRVIHTQPASDNFLAEESNRAINEIIRQMEIFESNENEYVGEGDSPSSILYNRVGDRIDFFFFWKNPDQ